jgi:TRAP-type transport system periplasmic protein
VRSVVLIFVLTLIAPLARAETVIRMATAAPEGTAWYREIRTFQAAVEQQTHGQVRLKVYFGGVAGDELQMGQRIRREQLDGAFSGGMLCQQLAPSMRIMGVLGLFQGRGELAYVLGRLKPTLDDEFRRAGFYNFGIVGVGPVLIFSRRPIRTLAEAKATRLWTWGVDETLGAGLRSLGFAAVPAGLDEAGRLYDEGKVDGFIAVPAAALAFQWSAQAKYLLPLRLAALTGCVVLANRAFDPLPEEYKTVVRNAAARGLSHLEEVGRAQDEALLGGLFARQGLQIVAASPGLRGQFFDEARAARDTMTENIIRRGLLDRVLSLLADYRAEHREVEGY